MVVTELPAEFPYAVVKPYRIVEFVIVFVFHLITAVVFVELRFTPEMTGRRTTTGVGVAVALTTV